MVSFISRYVSPFLLYGSQRPWDSGVASCQPPWLTVAQRRKIEGEGLDTEQVIGIEVYAYLGMQA